MANVGTDLPQDIQALRQQSQVASQRAAGFAAGMPTIEDTLKKRVNTLFNENQDVLNQFSQSVSNLVAAPSQAAAQFADIRNPFERLRMAAERGSATAAPAIAQAGLLGQRMGGIEDIVGAGTRSFQAAATQAQSQSELARQSYLDRLNEFMQMQQLDLQRRQAAASQGSNPLDILTALMSGQAGTKTGGGEKQLTAKEIWNKINSTIRAKGGTEFDVWKQIDALQKSGTTNAKIVGQLWKLHADLVTKLGGTGKPLVGTGAGSEFVKTGTSALNIPGGLGPINITGGLYGQSPR